MQYQAICMDTQVCVSLNEDVLPLLFRQQAEKSDNFTGEIQQAKGGFVEHHLAPICTGNGEQAIDHLGKARDFFQHASDGVAIFFRGVLPLQTNLADASDGAEGCSELVRCVGREALEGLKGVLQALQKIIEDAGHVTQLIVGVFDR
jgi:hypothetical protein